jgi:hypothetical protein
MYALANRSFGRRFPVRGPLLLSLLLTTTTARMQASEILFQTAGTSPQIEFGIRKLDAALQQQGDTLKRIETAAGAALVVRSEKASAGPDGFALIREGGTLTISGGDARGAMYGLLEVAEQLRLGTPLAKIAARTVSPRMEFRAIKFNLPFASYRNGPYLTQHQATCKDLKFWESFLDMMAENRFNVLSLWSLHPFHYMVVPKSFPEAQTFTHAEIADFRKLWTELFRMAKERGIETYLVNWNTFVSPAFAKAHNLPHSENWSYFGTGSKEKIVEDYMRENVTQVIDEYPDLTGLGITLGENMGGLTPDERRDWLEKTFYAGMAAAKRPVKFLYRAPLSANIGSGGSTSVENDHKSRAQIEAQTNNISGPVYVDFKYNWSHGHSSPDLFIVHGGKLSDAYWNPPPKAHKVVWTVRNEDFLVLRWGQPDFVREFEKNNRADYIGGVIIGSETYIPARDFITSENVNKPWHYAFERQWLFYSVWGHLLYDSALPDSRFAGILNARFGAGLGDDLLMAWKLASQMPLRFASFHQGTWDGALYSEGFCTWDTVRKLIDINSFISHPVLDHKRYLNIADYVKGSGKFESHIITPPQLADQLDSDCAEALKLVSRIRTRSKISSELECELTDIEAWCAYGNYFAAKIRAGVALAIARAKSDGVEQQKAVALLEKALDDWQRLSKLGSKFNHLPIPAIAGTFSWDALTPAVQKDIELARAPLSQPGKPKAPTRETP